LNLIVLFKLELNSAEESLKNFRERNRRIENSPSLQLEEQRLLREVNVLTSVFTTLKQQLETSKIEEVKKSKYVVIIDPPYVPLERTSPKRKKMVILAGVIGIIIGAIIGILYNNTKFFNPKNKEKLDEIKLLLSFGLIKNKS